MRSRLFRFLAAGLLFSPGVQADEFSSVVDGRIGSREWAGIVAEDLCRAFPERTGEIVLAVGREYPEGAMAAAIAAAKAVPDRTQDAADAAAKMVHPELREAAVEIVLSAGGH